MWQRAPLYVAVYLQNKTFMGGSTTRDQETFGSILGLLVQYVIMVIIITKLYGMVSD